MERARTLPSLLDSRAEVTPDAEALRFGAESLSFAAFRAAAHRLADVLRSEGVGRRDRVAVMVPNGLDMPIAFGFWTLSLLTCFLRDALGTEYPAGASYGFNYGLDRVRRPREARS